MKRNETRLQRSGPLEQRADNRGRTLFANAQPIGDRVEQDVFVVTSCFPHRKAQEARLLDELTLGRERLRVVIRDHRLSAGIVHKRLRDDVSDRYSEGNPEDVPSGCTDRT